MPTGITLQSQSPGAAGADLGFRLASMINGQPMAMRERELSLMVEAIAANRFTLPRNRKTAARHTERGTAIVEIHGVLIDRMPFVGSFWGMNSYEGLAEQFRRLATNDEIKRIVLDIDSPGGMVSGIRACADELARLVEKKPVYALANNMACSAGYWLACVAQELSVTPDGEVGSIGVRSGHVSYAEALDREGVAITLFKAGATKADLNPYALLDDGAAAEQQYAIERDYDRFCAHVAEHRPMSADEARDTDARTFVGARALDASLADRVETLEELIERVEKGEAKVKKKRKASPEPGSKAGLSPSERQPARPDPDQPSAGKSTTTKGARHMTVQNSAEDLAEAITNALAPMRSGRAAEGGGGGSQQQAPQAQAGNETAIAAAVEAERTRIFAIIESDDGKKRQKAAVQLAKAGLPLAAATAILATLPEDQLEKPAATEQQQLGNALAQQMAAGANSANVTPEAEGGAKKPSLAEKMKARRRA